MNRLDEAWLLIAAESPSPGDAHYEQIQKLKDYFVDTWLSEDSRIPPKLWNHHDNFAARTTNHVEGWHNRLQRNIKITRPNIFVLITHLKNEVQYYKTQMALVRAGNPPPRLNRMYIKINTRIMKLHADLESGEASLLDFIHAVSYNLNFQE